MAGRGRTSYQKRQKEQLRLERRQAKAARKQERTLQKDGEPESDLAPNPYLDELGPESDSPDLQDRV